MSRQFTNKTLRIKLELYGIPPELDRWVLGPLKNRTLPEGVTCTIEPEVLELSGDEPFDRRDRRKPERQSR